MYYIGISNNKGKHYGLSIGEIGIKTMVERSKNQEECGTCYHWAFKETLEQI